MCAVIFSVHRYIGYTISSNLAAKTHKSAVLLCRLRGSKRADLLCSVFHLLPQGRRMAPSSRGLAAMMRRLS